MIPHLPFEVIGHVLQQLDLAGPVRGAADDEWLGASMGVINPLEARWTFLALRLVSKSVKAETERQEPLLLGYIACRGTLHLLRICTEQGVDPADTEHYALLNQLKWLRMTDCEAAPSPRAFAALLKLVPALKAVSFVGVYLATDELLAVLAASPPVHLARITFLQARLGTLGVRSLAVLMPQLEQLDVVDLIDEPDEWVDQDLAGEAKEEAGGGGRLRRLYVWTRYCDVWPSRIVRLARNGLTTLRLDNTNLSKVQRTTTLAAALKTTSGPQELSMEYCALTSESLAALQLPHNRSIRVLNLRNNNLKPESVPAIGLSSPLLTTLNINKNPLLGADPDHTLAKAVRFSTLRDLDLSSIGLSGEGLAHLQLGHHATLVNVNLSNNRLTSKGFRGLDCRSNSVLRTIDVSSQLPRRLSRAAVRHVLALPTQVIILDDRTVRGGQRTSWWRPSNLYAGLLFGSPLGGAARKYSGKT